MKNKILVFMFAFILMFLIVGCSTQNATEIAEGVSIVKEIPRDQRLNEFNTALGSISDKTGARAALQVFADYVDSRLKEEDALRSRNSNDVILADALLDAIAEKQVEKKMILSGEDDGISTGKVSNTINTIANGKQNEVTRELVGEVQTRVREELPNIANQNENMRPIEALVVGYCIQSGDDGGAGPASVSIGASQDQIQRYVEVIIE
ncbi:MAG: hypothetical protein KKB81_02980 [Candidatus Margulisbacteria bacterium]|nr:hypothetical protein [Candidatus Margulisiibacteriota bacterium]MBU1022208.1 hypothetical protein [Candidatus Margulisiibacteriota bacterium]MBU1729353.1 hypothetical protein [Candidatus Margulisiibacteriota bacterium]MBU1955626.1 hypothetical protein [Candidatus Margulisiibacteriota bacterium]